MAGAVRQRVVKLALWDVPQTEDRWGIYLPIGFALLCWVWWKLWPVLPGFCIAFLAFAAVIMTVRADKFTRPERILWVVIGAALVLGEMYVLREDRSIFDLQSKTDREEQLNRFNRTAADLELALNRIDETLKTSDKTLEQTRPRAVIRMTGVNLKDGPKSIEANVKYAFNSSFENEGNAEAVWFNPSVRFYVGKPDDKKDQERIATEFYKDLFSYSTEAFDHISVVPGQPVWRTDYYTLTEDQVKELKAGQTLYYLARVDYKDQTGIWRMEVCQSYQRDPDELSENARHACLVPMPFRRRLGNR
jgi:hypothetical protein